MVSIFPYYTSLFPSNSTKQSKFNMHWNQIFHLGVSQYNTLIMTTISLDLKSTSIGSIATHCAISVFPNLASPNLVTTRIFRCLLDPRSPTLQMISKFSYSYKLHALTILPCPHVKQTRMNSMHPHYYLAASFNTSHIKTPHSHSLPCHALNFCHSWWSWESYHPWD